jgi:hypothetical protein
MCVKVQNRVSISTRDKHTKQGQTNDCVLDCRRVLGQHECDDEDKDLPRQGCLSDGGLYRFLYVKLPANPEGVNILYITARTNNFIGFTLTGGCFR